MKNILGVIITAVCGMFSATTFGANISWSGGANDGKWSNKGNWGQSPRPPKDGEWDNVTLTGFNLSDGKMVNDIGDMKIYALLFKEDQPVTLDSDYELTVFTSGNSFYSQVPSVILNTKLKLDTNSNKASIFYAAGEVQFNKDLTIGEGMTLNLSTYYDASYTGEKRQSFNAKVVGPLATFKMSAANGSEVHFNGNVELSRFISCTMGLNGVARFKSAGNQIGEYVQGYGKSYLDKENALSKDTVITWDDSYREKNNGRLYITGSQQADRIVNENIDLAKYSGSDQIRSAESGKPASLVLYGSADAICKTLIEDDISIVWNPDGDYVQEFRDRDNSTSGSLSVFNGTLRIGGTGTFKNVTKISACGGVFDVASTKAALTGLQTLEVKDGGRFKFSSSKDIKHFVSGQVDVSIAGGGVVELSQGMSVKVKSVVVDGEAQPEGLYGCVGNPHGAREAVWVEGDGFVSVITSVPVPDVAAVQSCWDGGAEDDLASSEANWADDAAVDLASGGLVAVFADAGTSANFEDGGVLKGIVFNARDDFTVSAAKPLHLRQAGISAVFDIPQGVKHAYTLNGPYKLDCTQEWRITNGVTLKINGSLAQFNDGEKLTLSGAATKGDEDEGIFEVSGDNLVAGTIELKKVRMVMCGTETKPASINGHGGELKILGSTYSSLVLSNSVVRKPVLLEGGENHRRIIVYGGTTNIIAGKMIGSWTPRFYINHKGCLINEGGVGAGENWIVPAGAGKESWWRIRCKPFFDEKTTIQLASITISLEAPDNKFKSAQVGNGSRICFGCDYAISNTAVDVVFTHPTAEIDLCGYDQLAGQLRFSEGQSVATMTSAEPAVYGFIQTNDVTFTGLEVKGAVSLAKYGKGKVTFDNDIVSTGGLTVGEGEFTFGPNGNWLNISNIVVSGTGKLTLPSSGLFGKKVVANVDTSEGGCIQLADGVCQRFASLTVDGVELPAGIYGGASASEGVIRSAAFCAEGSGIARVGALDFSIIVR